MYVCESTAQNQSYTPGWEQSIRSEARRRQKKLQGEAQAREAREDREAREAREANEAREAREGKEAERR
jgi:hypothetical protein